MVYKITLKNLVKSGLQSASIMFIADCVTQLGIENRMIQMDDEIEAKINVSSNNDGNVFSFKSNQSVSNHGICQSPVATTDSSSLSKYYDIRRTMRWTTAGFFLHGPYFANAFSSLDRYFGMQTTMKNVLKKTVAGQIFFFPPYLVLLFSYMSILEDNGSTEHVISKIQTKVPEAFVAGCAFWPIVNMLNFKLVPSNLRVPYVAIVGSTWNCFLSWLNG